MGGVSFQCLEICVYNIIEYSEVAPCIIHIFRIVNIADHYYKMWCDIGVTLLIVTCYKFVNSCKMKSAPSQK